MFSTKQQFYPSGLTVCCRIWSEVEKHTKGKQSWKATVFDPSAGKGDLLEYALTNKNYRTQNLYCCEIDPELRYTLQGKKFRWLDGDFLASNIQDLFDVVVLNPPFNNAATHILKAWEHVRDAASLMAALGERWRIFEASIS